jgi:hypothetical protein
MSLLHEQLAGLEELITTGYVLAIDPSSGSANSQPGYAIYRGGVLGDYGIIKLTPRTKLASRLFYLGESIRNDFQKPDILVVERINSVFGNTKGGNMGFMAKQMASLQRAVGVVQSCFEVPVIEVPPVTWRKYVKEDYKKTDEHDAVMLGFTAIIEAAQMAGLSTNPKLPWETNYVPHSGQKLKGKRKATQNKR